jgi:BirA family biotin operon repressor/biotin-[acetyl-CoA-carboxylase] ligase
MVIPELAPAHVERALTTNLIGHPVYYWSTIDSTMDAARRMVESRSCSDMSEGAMFITDEQTSGRGRLQRNWWAPAGSSLLLSLLFRPPLRPYQAHRLIMVCSLAVCDAIQQVTGLDAQIKWPNDILIRHRKVCGILSELDIVGSRLNYAIVGIGINVNTDLSGAPPFVSPATSLLAETGRLTSRLQLLVALTSSVEQRYLALCKGHSFHDEWAGRMATLGQHVHASTGVEQWYGLAAGVDSDGALLLCLQDGRVQRIIAGDVTLQPVERDHGAVAVEASQLSP